MKIKPLLVHVKKINKCELYYLCEKSHVDIKKPKKVKEKIMNDTQKNHVSK